MRIVNFIQVNREECLVMEDSASQRPYQDYVIKDGVLVGDFEGLYRDFEDPWNQSRNDHIFDSRRQIALNWCRRLRSEDGSDRFLELGCGFGHLTHQLANEGFTALGIDISEVAIAKAQKLYPQISICPS
jgi:2-polyprenyl-3-methyl-5-hydroxy-6-metoxy-1,4-benzoquinol methylase